MPTITGPQNRLNKRFKSNDRLQTVKQLDNFFSHDTGAYRYCEIF